MIRRRAIVGLSLLSALLLCAFATQSASAAEAKNTTAGTCVEGGGNKDFEDAHCDKFVGSGKGKFGHIVIPANTETEVHLTNEKTAEKTTKSTPATFKYSLGGVEVHIECTAVSMDLSSKSFVRNTEPESKVHKVDGTAGVIFENCTVKKPANCTVKNITSAAKFVGVEGLGSKGNEMAFEFKPDGSEVFAAFTAEGPACAAKGKTCEVKGTAIATGTPLASEKYSGATVTFSNANEMEKLEAGGKSAEFTGSFTVSAAKGGETEAPISVTTTT
jgi:hypothetical protein